MKIKTFQILFVVGSFSIVTACSSSKVKEKQSAPVHAATSESANLKKSNVTSIDLPEALNPEVQAKPGSPSWMIPAGSGMNATAAAALVGTVVGLSKIFGTTEVRSDLNGSCVYGDPESPMVSPCINAKVNLLDSDKAVLASSSTNQNGQFRFYIPAGQTYYVQIFDRKGRTAVTNTKVGRSQVVSLFLKP